jgi:tetratricopeptide (TPR) repeat protein
MKEFNKNSLAKHLAVACGIVKLEVSQIGIRLVWRAILCSALALGAYAQDGDLQQRLTEGRQLRTAGRYREAEQALTALLREAKRREPASVFVAVVLDSLATTEEELANYVEAERLLTDALSQLKKTGKEEGSDSATVKIHLGETYLEERRYREAEPILRKTLEMQQNLEHADTDLVAIAMLDLAVAYEHTRGRREAEQLLRQSLSVLEVRRGSDHPMLAAALSSLATVLTRAGRYDEALATAERAWRIVSRNPAVGDPDLLNAMSNLGTLYSLTSRPLEAEVFSKQAVSRAELIYGPDHPRLGYYLKAYALVLKRQGRKAEAKAAEKRSATILMDSVQANPVQHTINVNALR